MTTTRRSIAALNLLKSRYSEKISLKYQKEIQDLSSEISKKNEESYKDLMKRMEDALFEKFNGEHIEKILKCESHHSEYNTYSKTITIGIRLKFDGKETEALRKKLDAVMEKKAKDQKRLEDTWEMDALRAYAQGEGLPDFEV